VMIKSCWFASIAGFDLVSGKSFVNTDAPFLAASVDK